MRVLFFALLMLCGALSAQSLLPPIELSCSKEFPCPDGIRERVRFWASVYKDFGKSSAILHDSKTPERVYSVIKSSQTCAKTRGRLKRQTPVEVERTRLRNLLHDMADRLESGYITWDTEERRILSMFPSQDASEMREAAENIRCQTGNKDMFEAGLIRFESYRPMVEATLRELGLPSDIMFLPFVESSYNPKAMSRVGAAGMWQIMASTGRTLGLAVNSTVDERFDPEIATVAAARYLKQSYETLENSVSFMPGRDTKSLLGPFVITSYNYGIVGAKRMLRDVGPDFVRVLQDYSSRTAKVAVQNFYASFIAARHVALNREKYFPHVKPVPAPGFDKIVVQAATPASRLLRALKATQADVRDHNLSLSRHVWAGRRHIPKGFVFRVPKNSKFDVAAAKALWGSPKRTTRSSTEVASAEGDGAPQEEIYRVRRGDTACRIAKKFSVSCEDLITANNLGRKGLIRRNQILTIPVTAQSAPVVKAMDTQEPDVGPGQSVESVAVMAPQNEAPTPAIAVAPASSDSNEPEAAATEVASAFGLGLDLYVNRKADKKGRVIYSVVVQPEETLWHYADWLGVGVSDIEHRRSKRNLRTGQRVRLPIKDDDQKREFEKKRVDFFKTLEDEFNEMYVITGQEPYKVRRGDSEDQIAKARDIPLWLLRRFNSEAGPLRPGLVLTVPVVDKKPSA